MAATRPLAIHHQIIPDACHCGTYSTAPVLNGLLGDQQWRTSTWHGMGPGLPLPFGMRLSLLIQPVGDERARQPRLGSLLRPSHQGLWADRRAPCSSSLN